MNASNAVVTGGSGGIGVETAVLLAEQGGRHIIINGRNAKRGERARAAILSRVPSVSVDFVPGDVSHAPGAAELFREVAARIDGPLAVLVNCGGGDFAPELFEQTPAEQLDGIVRHWLSSRMHCCRAALPLMSRGGTIVNVASDAAKVPTPGEAALGAAMAGIVMFSRTLVAKGSGVDHARRILSDNHYGWFQRVRTGIYALNPEAIEKLSGLSVAAIST